jgi:hypothetical protein
MVSQLINLVEVRSCSAPPDVWSEHQLVKLAPGKRLGTLSVVRARWISLSSTELIGLRSVER